MGVGTIDPILMSELFKPKVRESDIAYHNGVLASKNMTPLNGEKANEINDKYPEDFSNGLLYGMSLTDEEFRDYMTEYKEAEANRNKRRNYDSWSDFGADRFISQIGKLFGFVKEATADKPEWI